jgi:uncharacterized protein
LEKGVYRLKLQFFANEMLYKSTFTEIKADLEDNMFEGYGSFFGNVDSHGDIVEKGAFKKTIKENKDRIKILWQHDTWKPIGKPVHMEEDSKGLYIKAKIAQTEVGKDAMTLMRDGIVNELSIGYNVVKDEWDRDKDIRRLKEVKLYEISAVTFASNPKATVTGVKFEDLIQEFKNGKFVTDIDKIQEAIKALEALLSMDEPSNDTQNTEKSLVIDDIDPNLYQSILQEIQKYK